MGLINRNKSTSNSGATSGGFTVTGVSAGKQKLGSIRKETKAPSGKRK